MRVAIVLQGVLQNKHKTKETKKENFPIRSWKKKIDSVRKLLEFHWNIVFVENASSRESEYWIVRIPIGPNLTENSMIGIQMGTTLTENLNQNSNGNQNTGNLTEN